MNKLELELPKDLDAELAALGLEDNASMSAWVADAIRQKLSALRQMEILESRAARGNRADFEKVLAKIPAVEPGEEDRW